MINPDKIRKYLVFLPFLALYIVLTIAFSENNLNGDQQRYYSYAENLTHGYYSNPIPNVDLTSGPGYPLLLAPFVFFKAPLIIPKLLNAILLYLSVIIVFSIARKFIDYKKSLILSFIFALYFPFFQHLPLLITEISATFFLVLFFYVILNRKMKPAFIHKIGIPSLVLAFLILTKIMFAYAVIASFVILIALFLKERSKEIKEILYILLFAIFLCSPYLVYTYSLTGKVFYWGGSRDNLYWMSSPYKSDLGDWQPNYLRHQPELEKNHKAFFDSIKNLGYLEKEKAFSERALLNLKNHPDKYMVNMYANIGRMFFNYPFSYNRHGDIWFFDLAYMFINMFFVSALILLCVSLLFTFFRMDGTIRFFILLILIYLALSALVSAEKRMFLPAIPLVIIWIAYLGSIVKFDFFLKR